MKIMRDLFCKTSIIFLMVVVLILGIPISSSSALEILPHPETKFQGKIGITYKDSQPDKSIQIGTEAPPNAPNILLILLDDVGFGAGSTFGGSIETPTLDRLAASGLSYNRFHTTALCAPTRAALLTGRNHHSVSSGNIEELATGYPGYTGLIPRNAATIAQILQANGYSTSWFGKNHNVPDYQTSSIGPYDRWPNRLGFDYFYGFIGGETDQWYPTLYENQNPVQQSELPEEGYNLTHDLADKAISWVHYHDSLAPDRPWFLYFAPGATHAPHQPPPEYRKKYQGKFDLGWDKEREIIFERQQKLGVIPANAKLTPRPEQIPAWDSFDEKTQKLLALEMENYAGFLEYTDREVGRVVDAIEEIGKLKNTLVIYIVGDNGASAEGSLTGTCNEFSNLNGIPLSIEDNLKCSDNWGNPGTSPHYAVGWAWATNAPFRWTKQVASYFGGTRNPMVISWLQQIKDVGSLREQFHHVIDIAPTILEAVGLEEPKLFNGVAQKPIEGNSLTYTFSQRGAKAKETHDTQYFEMFAHRAIYHDGWMASAFHREPWIVVGSQDLENDRWELFDLDRDFTQAEDISAENPDKLKELKELFLVEAEKYQVFPIDDRLVERLNVNLRPSLTSGRKHFEFYEGAIRLPESSAPNTKAVSHTITADLVIPDRGAEGVILANGGATGGYTLYVKEGKLVYDYNYFNTKRYSIASITSLPAGKVKVRFDFDYSGNPSKGGTGRLFINDRKVGEGSIAKTVPYRFGVDTQDVGIDLQAPVSNNYQPDFKFTGTIEKVTIDLK